MAIPRWIDQTLSEMLPILRDAGEGQHVEFMAKYPENGYELSREIAAFASSNSGTILIGVSDDGRLLGLPDLDSNTARDKLLRRIEGLCSGNIRPAITPVVKFAQENNAIVLVIEVPRGSQPIYYSKHTPYIRHLTSSRPAEPHEVIDRITESLITKSVEPTENDAKSNFLSSIAESLITTLILADQVEMRNVDSWLDYMDSQASGLAAQFREAALEEIATEMNLDSSLKDIADHLDRVVSHIHTLGEESWMTYTGHWTAAANHAKKVVETYIDPVPLSDNSRKQIQNLINKTVRQLADLDDRAEEMAYDGRMQELQYTASSIGLLFLKLTYYRINDIASTSNFASELRPLANELNLIETERMYLDGGQSIRRILDKLHNLAEHIKSLVSANRHNNSE